MAFSWVTSIIDVWKPLRKSEVTLAIPSASVTSAKSGTPTTQVANAKINGHVCGVGMTIFTGSVLTFKAKIEIKQNVQTAMKHILRGPRAVQPS